MRGEVLRGVSALRGNGRPSGRRGETQRTPGSAAGGNVCGPRAEEIRRGGEKPRGRSVIRCMAASDRRRDSSDGGPPGIVEARGSAHEAGAPAVGRRKPDGRWGGRRRGGSARTPRGVYGRKPQERKVSVCVRAVDWPGHEARALQGSPRRRGSLSEGHRKAVLRRAERSGRPRGPVGSGRGANPDITGKVEEGAGKGQRARYEALRWTRTVGKLPVDPTTSSSGTTPRERAARPRVVYRETLKGRTGRLRHRAGCEQSRPARL
jgi:hypothetical protein